MTWRRMVVATAVAAVLAAPAAAWGGGFATVGLSSMPEGTSAGKAWVVDLTILQHGRTPLTGVEPSLTIIRLDGDGKRIFSATKAGPPGVYRARVVFPSAGLWRYVVDDGFSQRHSYAPVRIGASQGGAAPQPAAATRGDDGPGIWLSLGVSLLSGLAAAGLIAVLQRRRGTPASPAAR